VSHGRHFVAVLKNGSLAYTTEVDAVRGETTKVDVARLETSKQRTAAWVVGTFGVATLAAGGVFLGLSLSKESKAKSILDARDHGNISPSDLSTYESDRDARDKYRNLAYVGFGVGAAITVTSVFLFAFDRPEVGAPAMTTDKPKSSPTPATPSPMDMAVVPVVGPGIFGGSFAVAF
jgi:hypothetical protein